ncbi:MAG: ERCC4 domain-containing protein [Archaeoglobaceae archaeon]
MILVDFREPERIEEKLRALGVLTKRRSLEVGDYVIRHSSFEIAVERKEANDFLNSIIDARLWRQIHALKERYKLSILAIVGDLEEALSFRNFRRNAVIAAIVTIPVKTGGSVSPIFFANEDDFCYALKTIEEKVSKGEFFVVPRVARKENPQVAMLTAIPGVGEKLAVELLKRFGSVQRVANASVAELMRVDGVGEKKARTIRDFFARRFEVQ